jgi:DNA polymerase III gamma/tau subunit
MHLELDTISPTLLVDHFLKEQGYSNIKIADSALLVFMSVAQTPTQIRNITRILGNKYADKPSYKIKSQDILDNFSAPSFSLCLNLLKAYVRDDENEMIRIFIELWTTGISYEDFLHELDSSIHIMGIIPAKTSQKIHQLLLRGWIYFAQGKTHTLDMMRLFLK